MKRGVQAALWGLTIVYWVAIFVLTHIPTERVPGPRVNDKTAHMTAYAILASLLYLSGCFLSARRWRLAGWVVAICLVYGAMDEFLQGFVNRSPELADWFADAAGALAGTLLSLLAHRIARRPPVEPLP